MSNEDPLVSVIIPHQAGSEILLRCLETVTGDPARPRLEIILVDNGSSDGSVQEAEERFPEIRVVSLPENQGYAGGCAVGVEPEKLLAWYPPILDDIEELRGLLENDDIEPDEELTTRVFEALVTSWPEAGRSRL